jgi:hypothetical protein
MKEKKAYMANQIVKMQALNFFELTLVSWKLNVIITS